MAALTTLPPSTTPSTTLLTRESLIKSISTHGILSPADLYKRRCSYVPSADGRSTIRDIVSVNHIIHLGKPKEVFAQLLGSEQVQGIYTIALERNGKSFYRELREWSLESEDGLTLSSEGIRTLTERVRSTALFIFRARTTESGFCPYTTHLERPESFASGPGMGECFSESIPKKEIEAVIIPAELERYFAPYRHRWSIVIADFIEHSFTFGLSHVTLEIEEERARYSDWEWIRERSFTLQVPDYVGELHKFCQEKLAAGALCLSCHLTRLPFEGEAVDFEFRRRRG